jgi:CubicO group peptidase (beta-lactamase class C family)
MTSVERRMALKNIALSLGVSTLPACMTTPPALPPIRQGQVGLARDQLASWVQAQMQEHAHANLSVAVLDGEQIVWAEGFGMANPAQKLQATAHTRYRAGSVSKVFTTLAVMQLVEQGRMDLDAPLRDVLPRFYLHSRFSAAKHVTPRQILQHRSGLPSDHVQGMWSDTPKPLAQLVEALRDEYMAAEPGTVQSYCNLGFSLLGAAIEHITGEPFGQWMHAHVLQPMGMQDSEFAVAPPTGLHAAQALDAKGRIEPEPGLRDVPAGGLNSTVLDLLQLARLWWGQGTLGAHRLLAPHSVAAMQTPPRDPSPADTALVGLGWHVLEDELTGVGPVLWHAGGTPHHHAQLMLLPQLRLAVAVMSSTESAGELTYDTALKALALMATAHTGVDPVRPSPQDVDAAHPPAPLAHYAGYYDTPLGMVHIASDTNRARATLAGKRFRLQPTAQGYTRLQYRVLGLFPVHLGRLAEVEFTHHAPANGLGWLLARRKGCFALLGTQLHPVPIPAAWRARLGTYRYQGADPFLARQFKAVVLMEEAGLLLAEVDAGNDSTRVALAPVDDTHAVLRGLGRSRGDTVYAQQEGAQWVMTFSGMRFIAV